MTQIGVEARRGRTREWPSTSIPTGWFQIGWSSDFPVNRTVPLRYFGCDLVAYRSPSGRLHLLDAYCPHMGAHLGYGGRVEGECIRCPYHGWLFDSDGRNLEVTYPDEKQLSVQTMPWPVHEVDDVVLAFHGESSRFEPPDQFARSEHGTWPVLEFGVRRWDDQRMAPQVAADNVCDAAHFKFVHRSSEHATLVSYDDSGVPFRAEYSIRFGAGVEATWATPAGPIDGAINTESWGVGLLWNRLRGHDDVISLLGVTPVSIERSDVRVSVWVPRTRGDGSELDARTRDRWVAEQHGQVVSDLAIWTNQTYKAKPPFLRTEGAGMRSYRKWSTQFYEASSARD